MRRYVIVGGGIAAMAATRAIRDVDADGVITVINGEGGRPYHRPLIPFLIKEPDRDIGLAHDPFTRYGARRLDDRVTAVDTAAAVARTERSGEIPYDRLLVATGASPVVPALPGIEGDGCHTLRTRYDALTLAAAADDGGAAVVLGGGLVGIKAALALRARRLAVTMVEQLPHVLAGRVDQRGAARIEGVLSGLGLELVTGARAVRIIRRGGRLCGVALDSGREIGCRLVVAAAGIRPATGFLAGSGIVVENGVVVDDRLETSVAGVYAAGDVARFRDVVLGTPVTCGMWTFAEEMGRCAGRNMAGGRVRYPGLLSTMNAADIAGVPVISAGMIEPRGDAYEVFVDERSETYRKLVFCSDVLAGFVFLGRIEGAGLYTTLVRNQRRLPDSLKERAVAGSLSYADFNQTS